MTGSSIAACRIVMKRQRTWTTDRLPFFSLFAAPQPPRKTRATDVIDPETLPTIPDTANSNSINNNNSNSNNNAGLCRRPIRWSRMGTKTRNGVASIHRFAPPRDTKKAGSADGNPCAKDFQDCLEITVPVGGDAARRGIGQVFELCGTESSCNGTQ